MQDITGHIGQVTVFSDANNCVKMDVVVSDVRERYGNTDYLVTPLSGSGQMWKQSDNVTNLRPPDNSIYDSISFISDDELDDILAKEQ